MGYFTASVEWAKNVAKDENAWKEWWYNPESKIYNFIGKDNIPFHTVIWQSELLGVNGIYNDHSDAESYDADLQLPFDVPANEFMNIEGDKFSKSRNLAIWLPDILERYQADAVRYYVIRTLPETTDSDFSWQGFYERVNNELLAAWGNLVNRVLGFAYKRFDGQVPEYDELTEADQAIIAKVQAGFETIGAQIEAVKLRQALETTLLLSQDVNAWLNEREPWKVYKADKADAARSIYTALQCINTLKMLFAPFVPFSSQQVHEYLGFDGQLFGDLKIEEYAESTRNHKALVYDPSAAMGTWDAQELAQGQALRQPAPLFIKLEPEMVAEEQARLGQPRDEHPIEV
ncbi:MAG: class I tRNA ligase family protein [Anaerolineae bacterium]|nr:class I tRNA ligase family protein [Anaerolineae bacterium]